MCNRPWFLAALLRAIDRWREPPPSLPVRDSAAPPSADADAASLTVYGVKPAVAQQRFFFVAEDPEGLAALWMSDGTEAGTTTVGNVEGLSGGMIWWLCAAGDWLFLFANFDELRKTDGEPGAGSRRARAA